MPAKNLPTYAAVLWHLFLMPAHEGALTIHPASGAAILQHDNYQSSNISEGNGGTTEFESELPSSIPSGLVLRHHTIGPGLVADINPAQVRHRT